MATKKGTIRKGALSKTSPKGRKNAGDRYVCETCGLAVTVEESCCCTSPCDLFCCDLPMKKKRSYK